MEIEQEVECECPYCKRTFSQEVVINVEPEDFRMDLDQMGNGVMTDILAVLEWVNDRL